MPAFEMHALQPHLHQKQNLYIGLVVASTIATTPHLHDDASSGTTMVTFLEDDPMLLKLIESLSQFWEILFVLLSNPCSARVFSLIFQLLHLLIAGDLQTALFMMSPSLDARQMDHDSYQG
mmetsp:Transcript_10839/g.32593  ORF Transcript_10839/g.32593 Transcript_10839/m.32593 type:complete len:121 (-) Transcript_10839:2209-2571(-)